MAIISETQAIKALQKSNPWWHSSSEIKALVKPYKRVAYKKAVEIIGHKSIRRFVILSGARRVGKTTIMYQMIDRLLTEGVNPRNILYASFDNPIIKMLNIGELVDIYDSLQPLEGERYIFFDEIQYAQGWELWMKVIYDTMPAIMVTATGSASPILEKGASDSGVGRWSVLKIPTASFYEYCGLLSIPDRPEIPAGLKITDMGSMPKGDLSMLIGSFAPLLTHFNRYIAVGGFPELALSGDAAYAQKTLREDVVDKVIKRDVLTLFNVRNPLSMEKLFLYLCMNSSKIFNKNAAANALEDISVLTIEDYTRFLEMSNLIYISSPMTVDAKSALKGRPKIYIADAAIRNAVLMIDDVLADDTEMGIVMETIVFKHIISFYRGLPANIGYYRKAGGNQKEVDIVIDRLMDKILCEVKYRNDTSISDSDAIISLSSEGNAKVSHSFVVTKSLADYGADDHRNKAHIFRVPALPFVYMLGMAEALGATEM